VLFARNLELKCSQRFPVIGIGGRATRNLLTSSVSAVTGACLVVRKSAFKEVGGLNEIDLPIAFNDVDFCLKVRSKGYRNIWTPHAEMYHHESASRGPDNMPEKSARFRRETEYMRAIWGPELEQDPFYNTNFSTKIEKCFQLAFPPRRQKPWLQAIIAEFKDAGTD
jgi:O-antigen biosynthesis protein